MCFAPCTGKGLPEIRCEDPHFGAVSSERDRASSKCGWGAVCLGPESGSVQGLLDSRTSVSFAVSPSPGMVTGPQWRLHTS